jgi:hypothetical protein
MPEPRRLSAWLKYTAAVAIGYGTGFAIIAAICMRGLGVAWQDMHISAALTIGLFIGDVLRGPR